MVDGCVIEVVVNIVMFDDVNIVVDNGVDVVGLLCIELMFIYC